MKYFFLFFCLFAVYANAIGIGVSPDKMILHNREKKPIFISNPNDFDLEVTLYSDCSSVIFEKGNLIVPKKGLLQVMVFSTSDCTGFVNVAPVYSSKGIGILPTVSIPVKSLYDKTKVNATRPSPYIGLLLIAAIVSCGLSVFFLASRFL